MNDERLEFLEQALINLDSDILFLRTKRDAMAAELISGCPSPQIEVPLEVWYVNPE